MEGTKLIIWGLTMIVYVVNNKVGRLPRLGRKISILIKRCFASVEI